MPDVELIAMGSDPGECDLRRLLHHVAELPRENEPAVAVHPGGLDEEHVAAGTRHGEPGRDAGNGGPLWRLLPEALSAEPVADVLEPDRHRSLGVAGGDPGRGLPQQLAELALELPDPRLTRVLAHDRLDQLVRDLDLVLAQTIPLDLPRPEVAARDRDLLVDGVTVEADDLHPVEQRPRDRLGNIARRDEDDLREVELDIEVVVAE